MDTYDYRKDNRTDQQFQEEIDKFTHREKRAAILMYKSFFLPKWPDATLEDYGTDNSGRVIRSGKVTQKSDYRIRSRRFVKGSRLFEMKVSEKPCVTLKEDLVKNFYKYETVVWVVNFDTPDVKFYFMRADEALEIFRKHGRYDTYFGPKKGWRLFEDQLDELQKTYKYPICTP